MDDFRSVENSIKTTRLAGKIKIQLFINAERFSCVGESISIKSNMPNFDLEEFENVSDGLAIGITSKYR